MHKMLPSPKLPPFPPPSLPPFFRLSLPPLVPSGWTPWGRAFVPSLKKSRHTFERRDFGGRWSPSVSSRPRQPARRQHTTDSDTLTEDSEETQTLPAESPEQTGLP